MHRIEAILSPEQPTLPLLMLIARGWLSVRPAGIAF